MKHIYLLSALMLFAALTTFMLAGCSGDTEPTVYSENIYEETPESDTEDKQTADPGDAEVSFTEQYEPGQLMCLADSEDEAKEIAELYGIRLHSFSLGVAVFETDEDLDAVIQRGIDNGWTLLEKNYISHIS